MGQARPTSPNFLARRVAVFAATQQLAFFFGLHAEEKLTASIELESLVRACDELS